MGQGHSQSGGRRPTTEELSHALATKFAKRCFTPLELYSFQDVFKSLADHQDGISYLKEETIARYLEIPDVLSVSPVLFQMTSYLGAFPFGQNAPIVLGFEEMLMVVVILTERYTKVLKKGHKDRNKLLFRSLAVVDRGLNQSKADAEKAGQNDEQGSNEKGAASTATPRSHVAGFAVDEPANDDEEDDDDLALAALESLDAIDVFKHGDAPLAHASIPTDNLQKLIMLLLLIAPLHAQERLSKLSSRLNDKESLAGLRDTSRNILSAFVDVQKFPSISFTQFERAISSSLSFLFNGLSPLFEHFLFDPNLDFTKRKDADPAPAPSLPPELDLPLLPPGGEILDLNVLSQLSFFMPQPVFRGLRLLYSGAESGFALGSFETHVVNWRAPTILLVSGSLISDSDSSATFRAFDASLPAKRFRDSTNNSSNSTSVVYGIYVSQPWTQTHKSCFGDTDTLLFQLAPTHDVFHASPINTDYISFTKPPSSHPGISAGCPHPKAKSTAGPPTTLSLGAVSLALDANFEYGVFTHDYTSGGGAFRNSETRKFDWQDRFEIESLEVWGVGGDEEVEKQKERVKWEEREAEARRRINLGTGDVEADRALLEMAGIIGGGRSGGSMG